MSNSKNKKANRRVSFNLPTMQPQNVAMRYLNGLVTEAQQEMINQATDRATNKKSDFNSFNAFQQSNPGIFNGMTIPQNMNETKCCTDMMVILLPVTLQLHTAERQQDTIIYYLRTYPIASDCEVSQVNLAWMSFSV